MNEITVLESVKSSMVFLDYVNETYASIRLFVQLGVDRAGPTIVKDTGEKIFFACLRTHLST